MLSEDCREHDEAEPLPQLDLENAHPFVDESRSGPDADLLAGAVVGHDEQGRNRGLRPGQAEGTVRSRSRRPSASSRSTGRSVRSCRT